MNDFSLKSPLSYLQIQSARTYMQENPNWLHANLHPNSGTRPNNLDPNIKTDNVPSSPESCHPIEVHAVDQKDIALTDPRDTADSRTVPTGSSMGLPSLDTDSLCESVEDLQYEIERMLNPIPTTRHTYNTIPHGILQLTDNYFSVLPPLNLPAQAGAHLTYANPMSSDPIIDDAAESPSSDVTAVSFQVSERGYHLHDGCICTMSYSYLVTDRKKLDSPSDEG